MDKNTMLSTKSKDNDNGRYTQGERIASIEAQMQYLATSADVETVRADVAKTRTEVQTSIEKLSYEMKLWMIGMFLALFIAKLLSYSLPFSDSHRFYKN